jgi:hypothetical protein
MYVSGVVIIIDDIIGAIAVVMNIVASFTILMHVYIVIINIVGFVIGGVIV